MPARWGLGPVFAFEWLTAARRWQMYALRALLATLLFAAILVVWYQKVVPGQQYVGPIDRNAYALAGEALFYAFFGTLLSVTLLVAPGATAGAVCLDKARGTLLHLLVTDLSNAEIVLGKLAVRLIPLLGLVAASLPVLSLCLWLGGIDPEAMLVAYAVTAGVAVLGSALAFVLSVWGRKTHEVLLAAYLFEALLLLAYPMALGFDSNWRMTWLAPYFKWTNPYLLAFSPYMYRGAADPTELALFLGFCFGAALICTALAVVSIRRVTVRQASQPARRRPPLRLMALRPPPLWPPPRLDPNPVLWREWHRRMSGWARVVWGVFWVLFGGCAFCAGLENLFTSPGGRVFSTFVNALGVAFGLLLVSVNAVTALAEERARGSLDVLLTTPLPTRLIVWGKWRGAFRTIAPLALLPTLLTATVAARSGRWWAVPLMAVYVLACGASVTSLGLAIAVWIRSLPRAVGAGALAYGLMTAGWVALAMTIIGDHRTAENVACLSPFFGAAGATYEASIDAPHSNSPFWAILGWSAVHLLAALGLYALALRTFDRCLGRVSTIRRFAATRVFEGSASPSAPLEDSGRGVTPAVQPDWPGTQRTSPRP